MHTTTKTWAGILTFAVAAWLSLASGFGAGAGGVTPEQKQKQMEDEVTRAANAPATSGGAVPLNPSGTGAPMICGAASRATAMTAATMPRP